MRRLLARGGIIAGTSAGDAMMSDPMFLSGRSAPALGIPPETRRPRRAGTRRQSDAADRAPAASRPDEDGDDDTAPILGPRTGPGMGFLPGMIVDSHFFERNRFGRLVAALETSQTRFGIGVGEDACIEYDLSKDEVIGVSVADALLVDVCQLVRDGLTRRGIRTRIIAQGDRISMAELARSAAIPPAPPVPALIEDVRVAEPGQNRQLASWRFFIRAQAKSTKAAQRLKLDGYELLGRPDDTGWAVVEIRPSMNGQ